MFQTYIKNYQIRYNAKVWHQALQKREVTGNNYHVTRDLKKAKQFADMVAQANSECEEKANEEHVIFSRESYEAGNSPVSIFAMG
jgi:hypothetical protein